MSISRNNGEPEAFMDIGRLINKILTVGMALAAMGILYKVTCAIRDEVIDMQRHGTVSLGAFNRRLERRR